MDIVIISILLGATLLSDEILNGQMKVSRRLLLLINELIGTRPQHRNK